MENQSLKFVFDGFVLLSVSKTDVITLLLGVT